MFLFRPIINTSIEYANFHFPAQHQATLPVIIELGLVIFSGGILANLFVIYLSFFSSLMIGNFKYIMGNVAICGLCCNLARCFGAFYQMYHDFMDVPYTATTCYARIVITYAFSLCMMGLALPLTAVNRYVVIVLEYDDWFTKQRVFLLCICTYLPLTLPLVDFLFAPYVTYYLDCDFILYTPYTIEVSSLMLVLVGTPLVGFCTFRVYRLLSQHITVVAAILNKTPEQIHNEKSILKAIVMQELVPFLCLLPTLLVFFAVLLSGWKASVIEWPLFSYGDNQEFQYTTMNLCFLIEAAIPSLDSLITLRVVKSYRRAADEFLAKFKSKWYGNTVQNFQSGTVRN